MMYTMMPEDLIYAYHEQDFQKQRVVSYNGIPLLVEKNDNHEYEVIRIMSTDPSHYLLSDILPGTKINL